MNVTLALLLGLALSAAVTAKEPAWLDIELENYNYPYPVQKLTLKSQQQTLKMAYMDIRPDKPAGSTVLLLHGKNFNGAYWQTTVEALVKRGHRVVVPDQIGFGKSSKPAHYQYTFQQLADHTKAVLDHLKIERTAVVGHSMGGMLATRFSLMFPDTVTQLVLVNPIGLEDYRPLVPYQSVDVWYQRELKQTPEQIKKYQQENYYDGKWKPEYQPWVDLLAGWTTNPDYPRIAWNAALTYDMIFTQPVVHEFSNLKTPTLLIIGTRDRTALGKPLADEKTRKTMGLYTKLGKKSRDAIPNAKLVELDDVGHMPHVEAFEQFVKPLQEFLQ